jgi:tetratricopeptide (TPR) repeat protein
MFTTFYMGPYQPLTWWTHALVVHFWQLDPLPHHLVNVALHAANAALVFLLVGALLRAAVPTAHEPLVGIASMVGALFFALHPLRIEPVAWVTERRELLGAFFLLLSVLAYLRSLQAHRRRAWLAGSLALFLLSLLSKAMGMTLPVVLFIVDLYPLRRWVEGNRVAVLMEKVPYVVLAAVVAAAAFAGQRGGPMASLAQHGLIARFAQAAYGLCFYLWKTVLPIDLSPLYLLPRPLNPAEGTYLACGAIVVAVTGAAIMLRRRAAWALAAWAAYVVMLLPVLGFAQTGAQIAADRYTYLACMPWAVLAGAAVYRAGRGRTPLALGLRWVPATLGLVALAILTFQHTSVWHDSVTLWDQAVRVDPTNYIAYNNRGTARRLRNDLRGAAEDFDRAVHLRPSYWDARVNRAWVRRTTGDLDGAIADCTELLRRNPRYAYAFNERGLARQAKGDLRSAIADYEKAVTFAPPASRRQYERNLHAARRVLD